MNRSDDERIVIEGPVGVLETVLEHRGEPGFIGVVCHPHPLFGGTMDNKVVTTLTRAIREQRGAALRFNFRGVGESRGTFSEGLGESEDLLAVVHWAQRRFPDRPLWLAGFSFGSFVAARGAAIQNDCEAPASHLLLVAPPVHHFDFGSLGEPGCEVTVIQGEDDEVVPPAMVYEWVASTPLAPDLIRFPDCGHFFHGRLGELRDVAVRSFPVPIQGASE